MTITPLTPQQVFDNALNGMRRQGYLCSVNAKGSCQYRGTDGRKCGIGHSIPDELYESWMDADGGKAILALTATDGSGNRNMQRLFSKCDPIMLSDIQQAHDCDGWSPASFEEAMADIAQRYGLVYTPVGANNGQTGA